MPKHVLVVDDNRHIRKAVCDLILSDSRLSPCSQAEDGLEGVEKATRDKPDLVVMDFSMPVMNGLEAARLIIKALPKVYIVLLTLHPEILNEELAKFGISAMVPKQRAGTDLIPTVQSLLGLSGVVGAA
jgi:chemotaxis response regulator CheB